MSAPVTREDLDQLREDMQDRFEHMLEEMRGLSTYQREQNGNVARLVTAVAVHEERITNMKDTKGRWLSLAAAAIVALGSWVAHQFGR